MSPRRQQKDPQQVPWVAKADIYPPLEGVAGSLPVPAYRAGQRVPWPDVERFSWQDQVRDPDEDAPQDSTAAARTVHPVVAAMTGQEPDAEVPGPPATQEPLPPAETPEAGSNDKEA